MIEKVPQAILGMTSVFVFELDFMQILVITGQIGWGRLSKDILKNILSDYELLRLSLCPEKNSHHRFFGVKNDDF